jgi:hypothetical protein
MCTLVTLTVPYLSTGLAGCSVNLGNNRDARKLARIPRVKKKKNNNIQHVFDRQQIIHSLEKGQKKKKKKLEAEGPHMRRTHLASFYLIFLSSIVFTSHHIL